MHVYILNCANENLRNNFLPNILPVCMFTCKYVFHHHFYFTCLSFQTDVTFTFVFLTCWFKTTQINSSSNGLDLVLFFIFITHWITNHRHACNNMERNSRAMQREFRDFIERTPFFEHSRSTDTNDIT